MGVENDGFGINSTAVLTAQLLADGKTPREIADLIGFLQLLIAVLKTYDAK